jgi:zeaxanthin glucosyltransferase
VLRDLRRIRELAGFFAVVFGTGRDKQAFAMLDLLKQNRVDAVICTKAGSDARPWASHELRHFAGELRLTTEDVPEPRDALMQAAYGFVCLLILMIFKSLLKMVDTTGIEALIIDPIQFYVELGAMKLGIPYITVAPALYLDFFGHTPLAIYDWPHEITPEALVRNREGIVKFARFIYNEGTKAYAQKAGLKIDWDDPSCVSSKLAYITQIPKAFDFENPLLPPQFHYTGPFHDGKGRPKLDFPWDRLTGEPLIYASMGTLMNGRADVFRTIVAGVAKHKGTQLVLSIGDQLDPKQIGPVPSNAIIVNQAPQLEVLKRTSVCISHAGLNTVLESLAQGVPQVGIPITFDQPGVATRIAAKKTGVTMPFEKLTSDHLATLLGEVLNNDVYRENARKLQDVIAKTNGLSMAADLVEQSLGVTQKSGKF